MVSQCANPKCKAPFLYLREGRLVAVRREDQSRLEFFWLCGECSAHLKFEPALDGAVNLVPASSAAPVYPQ